jgi:hypothetical protein
MTREHHRPLSILAVRAVVLKRKRQKRRQIQRHLADRLVFYWSGTLDEAAVWGSALTEAEAREVFAWPEGQGIQPPFKYG